MGLSGVLTAKLFKLEFLECSMHQISDIANFPSITHFVALAPRTPPGALDQFLFTRVAKTFPQLQSLVTERWFDDVQRAQESHPTLRSFSAKASASSGLNIYDRDDIVRHNLKVVRAESIPTLALYGDVEEMVKSSSEHLGPDVTSVAFVMHEDQLHLHLDSERPNVDAVDFRRYFRRIVANAGPCQSRQLVASLDNYLRLTKLSVSFKLIPHQIRTLFCSRPRVLTTLEILLDPHADSKGTVDVLTYDTEDRKWALPSTLRTFRLTAMPALAPELRTSYIKEGYKESLVIPTVSAGHVDRFIRRNAETQAVHLTVELVRVAFKHGREHADMQALKKLVKKLIVNGTPL
ncbi:hypothetical protein EXIGLDRAFT_734686 [Exidia glandulosa HHB12029]|uniref:Uncharacterized protein n=1 Tax=Exidia glandulosa HHB12029 TaxID=1314781 RepID=A0A165K5R7_EXIGL|nr:hypothetical protein EXIGLDRAFT_734686 [Exidia glandulosa HHB12029]